MNKVLAILLCCASFYSYNQTQEDLIGFWIFQKSKDQYLIFRKAKTNKKQEFGFKLMSKNRGKYWLKRPCSVGGESFQKVELYWEYSEEYLKFEFQRTRSRIEECFQYIYSIEKIDSKKMSLKLVEKKVTEYILT